MATQTKETKTKIVMKKATPTGLMKWCKLIVPDKMFPDNGFVCNLIFDQDDDGYLAFAKAIENARPKADEQLRINLTAAISSKFKKLDDDAVSAKVEQEFKKYTYVDSWKRDEEDEDGELTGRVQVCSKARRNKEGEIHPPALYTTDKVEINRDEYIDEEGEATAWFPKEAEGRASVKFVPYSTPATKTYGISLRLLAVMSDDLRVKGEGGANGADAFDDEELSDDEEF